jgi:hypothetical protein
MVLQPAKGKTVMNNNTVYFIIMGVYFFRSSTDDRGFVREELREGEAITNSETIIPTANKLVTKILKEYPSTARMGTKENGEVYIFFSHLEIVRVELQPQPYGRGLTDERLVAEVYSPDTIKFV